MIAGLVVLHAFRVLTEQFEKCPSVYLRKKSVHSKFILAADKNLTVANPKCYVCSPKPFVYVSVNVEEMTVRDFEKEILKNHLNMIAPDVILDTKGVVVISSEEGETEANMEKALKDLGIVDGSILKCDDFLQNYELTIAVNHYVAKEKEDPLYKVVANAEELKPKEDEVNGHNGEKKDENKDSKMEQDDEDDLMIVDAKAEEDPQEGSSSKRRKMNPPEDDDDDLVVIS